MDPALREDPNLIVVQTAEEHLLCAVRAYLAVTGQIEATITGEVAAGFRVDVTITSATSTAFKAPTAISSPGAPELPCL